MLNQGGDVCKGLPGPAPVRNQAAELRCGSMKHDRLLAVAVRADVNKGEGNARPCGLWRRSAPGVENM